MTYTDNLNDFYKALLELMVEDACIKFPTLTREEIIEDFNKFNDYVDELMESGISEDDALEKAQNEYNFIFADMM